MCMYVKTFSKDLESLYVGMCVHACFCARVCVCVEVERDG
jgi:hypothetical protein